MCTVGFPCATVYVMQLSALTHSYQPFSFRAPHPCRRPHLLYSAEGATDLCLACVAPDCLVAFEVTKNQNALPEFELWSYFGKLHKHVAQNIRQTSVDRSDNARPYTAFHACSQNSKCPQVLLGCCLALQFQARSDPFVQVLLVS